MSIPLCIIQWEDREIGKQGAMTAPGVMLGQIITQELERRGWPQLKLSELSGVPNTTLSRIVGGEVDEVRASIVAQIAKGFGEPFWQLMQRIGYAPDGIDDPTAEARRLATVFAADPELSALLQNVEQLELRDRDAVLAYIADLQRRRQNRQKNRRRRKADPQSAEESE